MRKLCESQRQLSHKIYAVESEQHGSFVGDKVVGMV